VLDPSPTGDDTRVSAVVRTSIVVFGSRIDAELASDDLPADTTDLLERTIDRRSTQETVPLSDSFVTLLEALNLRTVDTGVDGRLLWYDGDLYRYALYVNESS
jgi:hypothetical protein